MPEHRLRVLARVSAKADSVEHVRAILIGVVDPTRNEPGCLSYQLLQNRSDPTDFAFVEEMGECCGGANAFFHCAPQGRGGEAGRVSRHEPDIRRYSVMR